MESRTLNIESLCVAYGDQTVIQNLNLDVRPGELLALLGSSGCGKTTLLRTVAGLVPQKSGCIRLGDKEIQNLPPQDRRTALVFQNYALFPHMNVEQNVAYGLKIRKEPPATIRQKTQEILTLVGLYEEKDKPVHEISGGQQQRVALARSLIIRPDLLLFDEPLSNLDEKLREKMRQDIRQLQRELNITSLYVTHDQKEAMSIADRIVVMDSGNIQQIDTPDNLYHRPHSDLVARFMGHNNIYAPSELAAMFPKLEITLNSQSYLLPAEELMLGQGPYVASIHSREVRGNTVHYQLDLAGYRLEAVTINRLSEPVRPAGEQVHLDVNPRALLPLR